jgi:DNA-binding GntR family transcriptional regulator
VRLTREEIELQFELGQLLWGSERTPGELAATVADHHRVVDAIAARDAAQARELVEEHVGAVTARLVEAHVRLTRRGHRRADHTAAYPEAAGT